ncbi:glutamate--cysteine ligase [Rheinheimera sp. MMS21-TC3]|uniref:glutamate--cysteine ligase n=1 Tax=Rheinheimera sp. MMS21-TC3 TaxID=3072790 RepID=UPI0028C4651B|nr:glutamate--cysteine ligase [Rheinheimera sp. MMS21-TC3]WNO61645.1 glutamate--cysteine ligase [Rheinheimera sp. MMS21-TC3]
MSTLIQQRLSAFNTVSFKQAIVGIKRGIERETLRVCPDGKLALTPHNAALGSALTHSLITTDFSESLLEFITPATDDIDTTIAQLTDIHHFVSKQIGIEQFWPASMPCFIKDQNTIPLAQYGSSNVGRMKTLYRKGLHNRYGRMMQAISGVHFNFSFSQQFWQQYQELLGDNGDLQDFISAQYLGLIRNYKRYVWLMVYLFGASPAMCKSFLADRKTKYDFQLLGKGSLYLPYATSLRMSDLGYTSSAQSSLNISYNNLPDYVVGLQDAISKPSEQYSKIGVKFNNQYQQLNTHVLQIENEFYSTIRPKRTAETGERPTCALSKRGVEYVEVRALDVNPFSKIGINAEQMHFLDTFLLFCLLEDSPEMSIAEQDIADANLRKVVTDGRRLNLELQDGEQPRLMQDWAEQLFADMMPVAKYLDSAYNKQKYQSVLTEFYKALLNPALTYSGQILDKLLPQQLDNGEFMLQLSAEYKQQILQQPYRVYSEQMFVAEAVKSHEKQKLIEQQDEISFSEYLKQYYEEIPECDE